VIVIDASVVAHALAEDGEEGELARSLLAREPDLHVPHLLDLEVASFLRRRTAAGRLDIERARRAFESLQLMPARRYPHGPLLPRIWELRENVTPYDASYLALAEQLGCTLVTSDTRLARVRQARCPVEVLT
jgi:predicted nucleic acid-binding protein